MIRRSLFFTLLLFIIYSLLLILNPKLSSSQHQWQDNTIKAQRFLYENSDHCNNLLLGTSLSTRIVYDSIPNICNLALAGLSIFDGLEIVKCSGATPERIFIETNYLLKEKDYDFTNSLLTPVNYYLRKNLIPFREEKQPLGLIIKYLIKVKSSLVKMLKSKNNLGSIKNQKTTIFTINEVHTTTSLFQTLLKDQKESYLKQPDKSVVDNKLEELENYLDYFKIEGVEIFLFELPVNSYLSNLDGAKVIREKLIDRFSRRNIHFIPQDTSKYITTDGIHLGYQEALRYTLFFRKYVDTKMIK